METRERSVVWGSYFPENSLSELQNRKYSLLPTGSGKCLCVTTTLPSSTPLNRSFPSSSITHRSHPFLSEYSFSSSAVWLPRVALLVPDTLTSAPSSATAYAPSPSFAVQKQCVMATLPEFTLCTTFPLPPLRQFSILLFPPAIPHTPPMFTACGRAAVVGICP